MTDAIHTDTGMRPAPTGLRRVANADEVRAKLWQKAVEFEASYITQMIKPMFEGTQTDTPFGAGNAEDVWRSFELDEYGKAIARAGGIGLAAPVYRQLLAIQEGRGS